MRASKLVLASAISMALACRSGDESSLPRDGGGDASGGDAGGRDAGGRDASTGQDASTADASMPDAGASTGACRSVRMTNYDDSGPSTGCGYLKSHPFVAQFVRDGMTAAMAEPWYDSSYEGNPGESCGECWLVTSPTTSAVVMITDLCPIQGNPLCAGPQFHIDLAQGAATYLMAGGNDFGSARPVACPLSGNIHVEVTDRNWGYFQVAMINHIVPVRKVEYRAVGGSTWVTMSRVWGAVWAGNDDAFGPGGAGGTLRLTSAQGQVVTSNVVFRAVDDPQAQQPHAGVDLGVQFDNLDPVSGGACTL